MKQKAISLLLCAVLLMSVCVPGALGFRAWGEETEPPTFTTEEPTAPEETEPEFDPEQNISALVLGANSTAIQQITTHWDYTYYHAFQQKEAP